MAEDVKFRSVEQISSPQDNPVVEKFRQAAIDMGFDPNDRAIAAKIQDLARRYSNPTPNQTSSAFVRPSPRDIDPEQLQKIAKQREELALQVEPRAALARKSAPFMSTFRDSFSPTGSGGERAKAIVENEYAPLRAFDAQTAANKAVREADIEAYTKQEAARKGKGEAESSLTKAAGDRTTFANAQADFDPASSTSKAALANAENLIASIFPKGSNINLSGLNKNQIQDQLVSIVGNAVKSARTDAEKQNLLAQARLHGVEIAKVLAEARKLGAEIPKIEAEIPKIGAETTEALARADEIRQKARKGAVIAGEAEKEVAGDTKGVGTGAGTGTKVLGQDHWAPGVTEKMSALDEVQKPGVKKAFENQATQIKEFQNDTSGRNNEKQAIRVIRRAIESGKLNSGAWVGLIEGKYSNVGQEVVNAMNMLKDRAGTNRTDSTYQAISRASTSPDITQSNNTIMDIIDRREARLLKDELVGRAQIAAGKHLLNTDSFRSKLGALKTIDPKTKAGAISVHDFTGKSAEELRAIGEAYGDMGPKQIRD